MYTNIGKAQGNKEVKMSLACSACNHTMGPSEELPGREGVMVYPVVLSMIWADDEPSQADNQQWELYYVTAPHNISLCFRCIIGKLPKGQSRLDRVCEAYEAETTYCRAKVSEKGKWLSAEEWTTPELFHSWEEKQKLIPHAQCLFCEQAIADGKSPYFTARVIDKVYSEQHSTSFFGRNYSWTDLKTGMTSFEICFVCFRKNFPLTFQILGHGLRGTKPQGGAAAPKSEIYLTSQFIEALQREAGEEKAQEILEKIPSDVEIKLAVDPNSVSQN
jgi:hypothetical protein